MELRWVMTIYEWGKFHLQIEVHGKLVGKCLRPGRHIHTHARTDGQSENIMLPTPSTGWAKKWGNKRMSLILSSINRFTLFFTGRPLGKFAVNWLLKIPPLVACCYTTLWNINVIKQAINNKLQGSVATYLRINTTVHCLCSSFSSYSQHCTQ